MGSEGSWLHKAKLHAAMVLASAGYGGYNVLTKASLTAGVDPLAISTYRDALGCVFLFLYAFSFER